MKEAKTKSDQHNVLTSTTNLYKDDFYITNTYHHKDVYGSVLDSNFAFKVKENQ